MHSKNLTLLTDLYELTMMQGYYDKQDNPTVIFDVFSRSNPFSSGYAIAAGLEQVIEYVKNLNFSYDDVDYLRSLHIFSEDFPGGTVPFLYRYLPGNCHIEFLPLHP